MALRVTAASELVVPFLLVVIMPLIGAQAYKLFKHYSNKERKYNSEFDMEMTFCFVAIAASGVVTFVAILGLFNIWAWVGMFYPEAYAVHLFLLK